MNKRDEFFKDLFFIFYKRIRKRFFAQDTLKVFDVFHITNFIKNKILIPWTVSNDWIKDINIFQSPSKQIIYSKFKKLERDTKYNRKE